MIRVARALRGDLDAFEPLPVFQNEIQYLDDLKELVDREDCASFTFSIDDNPVGVLGLYLTKDRVLHFWAWFGEGIKQHPFMFVNKCGLILEHFIAAENPKEVTMYVRKGFPEAMKFSKFFGFKERQVVQGRDGTDYAEMVREN